MRQRQIEQDNKLNGMWEKQIEQDSKLNEVIKLL